METNRELLEKLMDKVNKKATVSSLMVVGTYKESTKQFHRGQYRAFCEVLSMLETMRDHSNSFSSNLKQE